jgi:hypothetical protein
MTWNTSRHTFGLEAFVYILFSPSSLMKLDPNHPCIIRMQSNHIYIFLSKTETLFMEAIELKAVKLQ